MRGCLADRPKPEDRPPRLAIRIVRTQQTITDVSSAETIFIAIPQYPGQRALQLA